MIKIGTSGFSFKDWLGTVYPKNLKPGDTLRYYQEELGFNCVEINSTYYTLISDKIFSNMEKKTGPGFEFTVKGYRGFTHDPFDPRISEKPALKKTKEDIDKFIYSVQPLREKNKLSAVLLQFPVFFNPGHQSNEYLLSCRDSFKDIPLVIEFRNNTWVKSETFLFLKKNNLSFCVVDEPKLPRLMPFINEVTSDIGYLRLHGKNKNWFNSSLAERYNYNYSSKELGSLVPEINKLDKTARKVFIFFNNCHAGSAAKNALSLKDILGIIKDNKQALF